MAKIGTAIITYRNERGEIREWNVGCDMKHDTEKTIQQHLSKHRPGCTFIGVEFIPDDMTAWGQEEVLRGDK